MVIYMTPFNEVFYYVNGLVNGVVNGYTKWSYKWLYKEVLLNGHTGGMAALEWDNNNVSKKVLTLSKQYQSSLLSNS